MTRETLESIIRHAITAGMDAAHTYGYEDVDQCPEFIEEIAEMFIKEL